MIAVTSRKKEGKWYWFLPTVDGTYSTIDIIQKSKQDGLIL